jgi:hypothetical protein
MSGNRFWEELIETAYALWVIFCHMVTAIGALAAVRAIEVVIQTLWPGTEPTIFGKVPLKMIIETADGGILIIFLVLGLYRAAKGAWQ